METYIRPYHPSDLSALYRICLQTGDSGSDATDLYQDPELIGHFYAGPYAVIEPDLCFVLCCAGEPCGYIIGTRNSEMFYQKCEQEWFPVLRRRYPLPEEQDNSKDAHMIRLLHQGIKPQADLLDYPAHLHIDILPKGQGKGAGRNLINTLINRLKELKIPALHLQVGKSNEGAVKFYERVGFHRIKEYEFAIAFGIYLNEA